MNELRPLGLYLFTKEAQDATVLKELLQFLKSHSPKNHSFAYVEAKTSLHPQLSLWENLQLEVGSRNWKEFQDVLKPEWLATLKLLKDPTIQTHEAEAWEKFLVSLLKGLMTSSQHILIDMNESLLSPFMIQQFKKATLLATKEKTVYLATANTSLWIDCAHTLVGRKNYKFEMEPLDSENLKLKWAL